MTATANYTKILRSDLQVWDGRDKTGSKRDFTGGRTIGLKMNNHVDVLQAYGEGTNRTYGTLADAVAQVGEANVEFEIAPGTWTITSNLTIPSNISMRFPRGAVLNVSSGITLTLNCGIIAGLNQIFSGSGSFAGSPLVDRFFPEWFGAKRDGTTDDQSAINAAVSLANAGNGEIFFSSGTYVIGTAITVKSNVHFNGAGTQAIVKLQDSSNIDAFSATTALDNVRFSNFKIDGNKANQSSNGDLINLTFNGGASDNIAIDKLLIVDAQNDGIILGDASTVLTDIIVSNNTISGTTGISITLSGNATGAIITGNNCDAITIGGGSEFTVVSNNYIRSGGSGIAVSSSDTLVAGNVIDAATRAAIQILSSSVRCVISNNMIHTTTNSGQGIYIFTADNCIITGNYIRATDGIAINLAGGSNCLVSNNYIDVPNQIGISLVSTDSLICQNIIVASSKTQQGITIGATSNGIVVSHNRITGYDGSGGDGIEITNSSNNTFITITDNDLRGNTNALTIGASATDLLIHNNRLGTTLNTFVVQGIIES